MRWQRPEPQSTALQTILNFSYQPLTSLLAILFILAKQNQNNLFVPFQTQTEEESMENGKRKTTPTVTD